VKTTVHTRNSCKKSTGQAVIFSKSVQALKRCPSSCFSFPIVDRFASDVPMLSDNAFKDGIRASIQRILREGRGQTDPPPNPPEHPSQPTEASAKEGAQAPVPPVLPAQDPLVPPGSPSEARLDGKKPETIDPAPLTTAPDTLMSSPGPS
jgi:hypothetical protein